MEVLKFIIQSLRGNGTTDKDKDLCDVALRDSIDNAMLLILTASENAIELNKEAVKTVIEAKYALKSGNISQEIEHKFWLSYEEIACSIQPINIDSIKATYDPHPEYKFFLLNIFKRKKIPLSRKCATNYKLLSLTTLILLIAIQIYWYIGLTLTTDINTQSQAISELNTELSISENQHQKWQNSANSEENHDLYSIELLRNRIQEHTDWKDAAINHLQNWNEVWSDLDLLTLQTWQNEEYSSFSIAMQRRLQFIAAGNALQAISEYILPILYGLIGACFYILRQLPKEIDTLTFTTNSYINYSLRIVQGPLAGIMVSFFITPDRENPVLSTVNATQIHSLEPAISSLSPLAIAFLAGYSIEFIFKFIDKILTTPDSESVKDKKTLYPIHSFKKQKPLKRNRNSE